MILPTNSPVKQAPKVGGCATWTNAFYRKVLEISKMCDIYKVLQNVINCAKLAKFCKLCKIA